MEIKSINNLSPLCLIYVSGELSSMEITFKVWRYALKLNLVSGELSSMEITINTKRS